MRDTKQQLKKRVVVIGGGTGTHMVLRGLKRHAGTIAITAIVSMADSGGSTGRLRDEFGQLPVGDVRNALTALADTGDEHGELLRQLFLYRFEKGVGLSGHNFGNLLLTALTDILGSETAAIHGASMLLRVAGEVIPVTTGNTNLRATYDDGVVLMGESVIDEPPPDRHERSIVKLELVPEVDINPAAAAAIEAADLVVIGPGDLYTSLIPNALARGFSETLQRTTAPVVYICNLMSRHGQTYGKHAQEHLDEVISYFGHTPRYVLVNSASMPSSLIQSYGAQGEHPVQNNCSHTTATTIVPCPLVAAERVEKQTGDTVRRSYIRHDHDRLAAQLISFLA